MRLEWKFNKWKKKVLHSGEGEPNGLSTMRLGSGVFMYWEGEGIFCLWAVLEKVWFSLAWNLDLGPVRSWSDDSQGLLSLAQDLSAVEVMIRRGQAHSPKRKESVHWTHHIHAHKRRRNVFLGTCWLYKGQRHFYVRLSFFIWVSRKFL